MFANEVLELIYDNSEIIQKALQNPRRVRQLLEPFDNKLRINLKNNC